MQNSMRSVRPESSFVARLEQLANRIRREMHGFETLKDCQKENHTRIKRLRRVGKLPGKQVCLNLAEKLENCQPEQQCGSMACMACQRTRRLNFVGKWLPYLRANPEYSMVTLIFYEEMLADRQLLGWKQAALKERLRKQLVRIGFNKPIFGGFEMDYHFYTHQPEASHWMPHFHLLMPREPEKLQRLRKYMLREQNQSVRKGRKNRPMREDKVIHPLEVLTYCVAGMWQEKVWFLYQDETLKSQKKLRRIRCDKIFSKSLVVLDRMGESALNFSVNVQKK